MQGVYQVSIPNTRRDFFDYCYEGEPIAIGSRVLVPFRKQIRLGFIISQRPAENPAIKLRAIEQLLDTKPLLQASSLSLLQWISQYYQAALSEVLALAIPKNLRAETPKPAKIPKGLIWNPAAASAETSLPKQAKRQWDLLNFLKNSQVPLSYQELRAAHYTSSQCAKLLALGLVQEVRMPAVLKTAALVKEPPLVLNAEQAAALEQISQALGRYQAFLLQGVTGSGKTEVYLQLIQQVLDQGKQVLVLVPEIGLTPQLLARFTARIQCPMAVLHSQLPDREREAVFLGANAGDIRLLIGTRSAIFTPLPELGLIIIDEEHDSSLKQMDGVRYSARDVALMRAHLAAVPIVLGTATPSLETLQNCQAEKYQKLILSHKAMNQLPLQFHIQDLRNKKLQHGLTESSLEKIHETLLEKQQVLVFINRRGYAPVLLCHQCGHMEDCRDCDSHMTLHQKRRRLICHHCGRSTPIPSHCQDCGQPELLPIGAGTQRIETFLQTQFPDTTILRIDRDEVQGKAAWDAHLDQIHSGGAELIIGTQMLAKGHHFPRLSLVLVLEMDQGFYNQDFRALERFGQLLTQVAGRAGRAELPGQVIIQTHVPQHPLLNCLVQSGYEAFSQALLAERKAAALPPFAFLALIRAQAKKQEPLLQFLHALKGFLKPYDLQLLGPAPAPLAKKAGQERMQLLIKCPSRPMLQRALTQLREWISVHQAKAPVRWSIDVDPLDLA